MTAGDIRIGQFVPLRTFMVRHLDAYADRDPRSITRAEMETEWTRLVREQMDCQQRFLSAHGRGSARRVNPMAYARAFPHDTQDPRGEALRQAALAEELRGQFSELTARVEQVEERQKTSTETSRRAERVARKAQARAESTSQDLTEFRKNLAELFRETFRGVDSGALFPSRD